MKYIFNIINTREIIKYRVPGPRSHSARAPRTSGTSSPPTGRTLRSPYRFKKLADMYGRESDSESETEVVPC